MANACLELNEDVLPDAPIWGIHRPIWVSTIQLRVLSKVWNTRPLCFTKLKIHYKIRKLNRYSNSHTTYEKGLHMVRGKCMQQLPEVNGKTMKIRSMGNIWLRLKWFDSIKAYN